MYISEVIIDGFKSYAQRTVVSGFDPQFNAITGLNGSGKSNILDSICFVLGISNLSQVRVGNLQELVYKQGQAGVTKATVTIVFNNADPSTSPVGYETNKEITVTRQVVIGGKNKYMINGHTVQQSAVQNLFHSVQLNVNNPHFLIMQGRITKVLNMKPHETLSMIEEAAGTRMFETKKQAAIKTIEKKQLRVEEITKCMTEEITPTLEGLRDERQHYLTWQANNLELERLERFCVAADYRSAEQKVTSAEADKAAMVAKVDALQGEQDRAQKEADEKIKKAAQITSLRDAEVNGVLDKLKLKETELSKDVVKAHTQLNNHSTTLASERESLQLLTKQTDSTASALSAKTADLQRATDEAAAKETQVNTVDAAFVQAREKYQNACAGVADVDSAALLSLPEQVGAWEKRAREAESQLESGKLRSKHAAASLKELAKQSTKQQAAYNTSQREVETLRAKVTSIEEALKATGFGGMSEDLSQKAKDLRGSIRVLKDEISTLAARSRARLSVEFKDPERGFDQSRVKGVLARLFTVKDSAHLTALELIAGGKLQNLVVDTAETANLIVEKGSCKKRITFLPLDKLAAEPMRGSKVVAARAVAASMGGTAMLALELVKYDKSIEKAVVYAFGSVLVCSSAEVANAVSKHPDVRAKTVTLDGDIYDPNGGTLTGGSSANSGNLLASLADLTSREALLAAQEAACNAIESQLKAQSANAANAEKLQSELETKRYALQMAEQKLSESSFAQTAGEIAALEKQIADCQTEATAHHEAIAKSKEELRKLKSVEQDIKKAREGAMKDVEAAMKAAQKASNAVKSELSVLKGRRDALDAELKALTKDSTSTKEQLKICESSIARMEKDAETLQAMHDKTKKSYEEAAKALAAKQAELDDCSKEIKSLKSEADSALKRKTEASLEAREWQGKVIRWEKDFKEAGKVLKALVTQHPWIEKEKAFFGQAGSDFDFTAKDVPASNKRLKEIKAEQDRITRKINKKVMGMIEKAETEYAELSRKKEVILNDKAKIEAVIEELDVKKAQALQTTWVKVNKDFGSIFSMLLPGTHAKLEPPEGESVTEGLEVKVSFNGVWKESLTELSGGQRSLLALSLILALLLFKPAPMYILDEVDAALDLSHTQNIGLMLRTHFSTSQFIVVSLKEGMFNNANVIFRTRFVDGVSAVSRTMGRAKVGGDAPMGAHGQQQIENEGEAPSKKKGKAAAGSAASSRGAKMIEA